jgi:hypothetical protein
VLSPLSLPSLPLRHRVMRAFCYDLGVCSRTTSDFRYNQR